MFAIEGKEMSITRGDTAIINFKLDNHTFVEGDTVYFSVKKNISDSGYAIHKVITTFTDNTAKIQLSSIDTKIEKGKYFYDIQCNLLDGRVDTVVNKERFIVLEEVNNE